MPVWEHNPLPRLFVPVIQRWRLTLIVIRSRYCLSNLEVLQCLLGVCLTCASGCVLWQV